MNRDTMIAIIASLFFLLIVSYTSAKKQKRILAESKLAFESLHSEAIELDTLKKKWKDKNLANRILSQMKNKKLVKDEKSGKNIIFEFENLQRDEVDNITNKLLNSTLKIKELSINKNSELNVTLGLKVLI